MAAGSAGAKAGRLGMEILSFLLEKFSPPRIFFFVGSGALKINANNFNTQETNAIH